MDKCSIQESLKVGIHEVENNSVSVEQCRFFNRAALNGDLDTIVSMMANGYPTDTADENGSTVLHFAAQGGHVNVIRKIVENTESDIDVVNKDGCSPLHVAAAYGRLGVVRMLLSRKAKSLLVTGNNVNISIQKASYHVNNVILSRIRGGTSSGMVLCSGFTVLHCAAQGGSPTVIKELVKIFKYDVNATADNGCSPLHIAAALGMKEAVMELIQQGANISMNVPMYGTPLHQAALYGHRDVVRLLLGELHTVDAIGCSALHFAAEGGHVEVIRELVNVGGDIRASKETGSTPLHVAAYFGKKDAVFELIRLGAPVCLPSGRSGTPLHQAALGGHLDIFKALIDEGCSTKAVSSEGFNVLHSAVSGGCLEVISELVKQGYSSTILDAYTENSTPCVQEKLSPLETSIVTGQGCKLEGICDVLGLAKSSATQECTPYSLLSLLFSRGLLVQERLLHLAAIPGDFQFLEKYFCDSKNAAQCIVTKSYSVKAFRYVASSLLPSSFPLPDSGSLTPLHISIFSANGIKTGKYRIHANSQFSNHNHFIRGLVSHPVLKGTINMLLPTGHTALDLAKHFGLNDVVSILKSASARPGVLNEIPPELYTKYYNQLTTLNCSLVSLYECEQGQQVADLLYTGFQKHYQQSSCNFPLDSKPEIAVLDDHVIPRVAAENDRVAIHLGVKNYVLKIAEKDHSHYGCKKVCLNLFECWLAKDKGTGNKERTWRTVLNVVEKLCGAECVKEIKEDIRQDSSTQEQNSS